MSKLIVALLLVLTGIVTLTPAKGQDTNGDNYVQVLLPIAISSHRTVAGAYGSAWKQEVWVANNSGMPFGSLQPTGNCPSESCTSILPAGVRLWDSLENNQMEGGALFSLHPNQAAGIQLSSRLLEISRRAQPNGIEIPIIREDQFFKGTSTYLGIPSGPAVRARLRVYDPRHQPGSTVRVEVLDVDGKLIAETTLSPGNDPARVILFPRVILPYPAFALIGDLATAFPAVGSLDRYHIRITPLTPGMEYWAFVAVTDVETQHLLLITSQ